MNGPTPNTDELVAIYQHIKANPKEWNQDAYARKTECGTAYCVAGWAVVRKLGADRIDWEPAEGGDYLDAGYVSPPDGNYEAIHSIAAAVLGLYGGEADRLFDARNSLDDIRGIITELTGVDPEPAGIS